MRDRNGTAFIRWSRKHDDRLVHNDAIDRCCQSPIGSILEGIASPMPIREPRAPTSGPVAISLNCHLRRFETV